MATLMIADRPVNAGHHIADGSSIFAIENAYGNQRDLFRDSMHGSADDSSDVRAVTVAVGGGQGRTEIETVPRAAAEVRVRGVDAAVENVRGHAAAGLRVDVALIERQIALIDAIESPSWRRILRCQCDRLSHRSAAAHRILFDILDARLIE